MKSKRQSARNERTFFLSPHALVSTAYEPDSVAPIRTRCTASELTELRYGIVATKWPHRAPVLLMNDFFPVSGDPIMFGL